MFHSDSRYRFHRQNFGMYHYLSLLYTPSFQSPLKVHDPESKRTSNYQKVKKRRIYSIPSFRM